MKILASLFILIISLNGFAQNNAEVIYKASLLKTYFSQEQIKKSKNPRIKSFYEQMNKGIEKNIDEFEFTLTYSDKKSFFKLEDQMDIEADKSHKAAYIAIGGKDKYYLDTKTNQKLRQTVTFGKKFIIQSDINSINWKLHPETRLIQNFLCHKATTVKKVINSKGTFEKPVVAWYTKEIPIKHGPRGYGGLPGLILKLQEDKIIYYATKIDLNKKIRNGIKKPTKGKLVSKKEYDDFVLNSNWNYGD